MLSVGRQQETKAASHIIITWLIWKTINEAANFKHYKVYVLAQSSVPNCKDRTINLKNLQIQKERNRYESN